MAKDNCECNMKEKRHKTTKKKIQKARLQGGESPQKNWFKGVEQRPPGVLNEPAFKNLFKLVAGTVSPPLIETVPAKYMRTKTPPGESGADIQRQLQEAAERARRSAEKKAKKEMRVSPKPESSNVQEPKPQRASARAARDTISRAMTPDDEFFDELLESQDIV